MVIYPKLPRSDAANAKWIKMLLRTNGEMSVLRLQPEKYPYRYQPIMQTTSRERICRQDTQEKQQDKQQERQQQETKAHHGQQNDYQKPKAATAPPTEGKSTVKQKCETRTEPVGNPKTKETCQPGTYMPTNDAERSNQRLLQNEQQKTGKEAHQEEKTRRSPPIIITSPKKKNRLGTNKEKHEQSHQKTGRHNNKYATRELTHSQIILTRNNNHSRKN